MKAFLRCFAALIIPMLCTPCIHAQIINIVAGTVNASGFYGDGGQATNCELNLPIGVVADDSGNLYIADLDNYRIRKVTAATGIITTIGGSMYSGYSGDGGQATDAKLGAPYGIALDDSGNIYIADNGNSRIRKITKVTGIITTIAGDSTVGYKGDGGLADTASLYNPTGVAVDDSGNIYIADYGNSHVRKVIKKTGIIVNVAGVDNEYGFSGDGGQATDAKLFEPAGVALDDSGNIYFSDNTNNRIRKITKATGIINTIAGDTSLAGFSGDGEPATDAELDYPFGLVVDGSGNVYFADEGNNRIRLITKATGIITTYAGGGKILANGRPADSVDLDEPIEVCFNSSGNLFISDQVHEVVLEVTQGTTAVSTLNYSMQGMVYPNPSSGIFYIQTLPITDGKWNLYDVLGQRVASGEINSSQSPLNFSFLPQGIYVLNIHSPQFMMDQKISIVK